MVIPDHGNGSDGGSGSSPGDGPRRISPDIELEVEAASPLVRDPATASDRGSDGGHAIVVLVVDDDADMRRYVRRALRHMGDRVGPIIESENGQEALTKLEKLPVGLIISDVVMPVIDGYEMTAAIRRHAAHATVPILLITGEGSPREVMELARKAGAQAVLVKPFNAHELCRAVEEVLER